MVFRFIPKDTAGDRLEDCKQRVGTQIQAGCPDITSLSVFRRTAAESRRFAAAATDTTDLYPRTRPSLAHAAPSPLRPLSSTPAFTFLSNESSHFAFPSLFLPLYPSLFLSFSQYTIPRYVPFTPFRFPSRIAVCGQHRRILGSGSMIVISSPSYIQPHLLLQHSLRLFFGVS